jgi:hypothetical protein
MKTFGKNNMLTSNPIITLKESRKDFCKSIMTPSINIPRKNKTFIDVSYLEIITDKSIQGGEKWT